MAKLRINHNPNCPKCGQQETQEHMLIECVKLKGFWEAISKYFRTPHITKAQIMDMEQPKIRKNKHYAYNYIHRKIRHLEG